ncbi:MAG: hypothetical protein ACM3XM_03760 [Mycobacterium leprae]
MDLSSPRRFVVTFLAAFLVSSLLLAGFNFTVNPLGYYPPHLVQPLSYGDQLIKLDLMKQAKAPDLVILGSSRTMKLSPADVTDLTGWTAFNGGVSSSRPEEWYAMLSHALNDLHWHPKALVLGVDAETLFYHGDPNDDLLSSPDLRKYLPLQMWAGSLLNRTKLLISYDQTLLSKKALGLAMEPNQQPKAITFESNGLLHYVGWEKAVQDGTYQLGYEVNIKDYQRRYAATADFDAQRQSLFERTLDLAARNQIQVYLFLTPFHPGVLAAMQQDPDFNRVRSAVLPYLQGMTEKYPGVTFTDLTDIHSFGGDPNNFFDGVHYRQENARLILARLLLPGR